MITSIDGYFISISPLQEDRTALFAAFVVPGDFGNEYANATPLRIS
jgi:hypothetical protein